MVTIKFATDEINLPASRFDGDTIPEAAYSLLGASPENTSVERSSDGPIQDGEVITLTTRANSKA